MESRLVLPAIDRAVEPATDPAIGPTTIEGVVVALPSQPDSVLGTLSLSIELAADDAAAIAAVDDVRVVLLPPALGPEDG